MATSTPISAVQSPPQNAQQADAALVHAPAGQSDLIAQEKVEKRQLDAESIDPIVARIPVELDIAIPLPNFRVRNLLALAPGELIASKCNHGSDLPLAAGHVTLAWTEFEVLDTTLAVRITRLTAAANAVTSEKTQLTADQTDLMQADLPEVATKLSLAHTQQTALMSVIAQLGSGSLFDKL